MHSIACRFTSVLLVSLITLLLGACAQVKVQKVPTPTQYVNWTDEMQRKADAIEGFRFHLPRPWVNVFESFPIHSEVYIATGMVSADGRYVVIRELKDESGLDKVVVGKLVGVDIPVSAIGTQSAISKEDLLMAATAQQQSGEENTLKNLTEEVNKLKEQLSGKILTGASEEQNPEQPTPAQIPAPSAPPPPTGQNQRNVTNDNGAYAYQPMRGNMDIAYILDFEEQYAVQSQAGLGNAQFALNLGQGWSLQGFNSLADNSQLNNHIFNLIDTATKAAAGAITSGGSYLTSLIAKATPSTSKAIQQSGNEDQAIQKAIAQSPGTDVSVKITVVYYAAKGLYPLIKPRDLQERLLASKDGSIVIDITKGDKGKPVSSHPDPDAIKRAQEANNAALGHFSVPRYPYQYISFNTFRVLAVEAIDPTTEPFGHLIPKTGTEGSSGDRQAVDLAEHILAGVSKGQVIAADTPRKEAPDPVKTFANKISEQFAQGQNTIPIISERHGTQTLTICSAPDAPADGKVGLKVAIPNANSVDKAFVSDVIIKYVLLADEPFPLDPKNLELQLKNTCGEFALPTNPQTPRNPTSWQSLSQTDREKIQKAVCLTGGNIDGNWGAITSAAVADYINKTGRAGSKTTIDHGLKTELLAKTDAQIKAECGPGTDTLTKLAAGLRDKSVTLSGAKIKVDYVRIIGNQVHVTISVTPKTIAKVTNVQVKTELIKEASAGGAACDILIANWDAKKTDLGN